MSTKYSFFKNENENYLEDFPALSEIIRQAVQDAGQEMHEGQYGNPDAEPVECQRRDGFIPAAYNRGGWEITDFTTVDYVTGSGYWFASKAATKTVERYQDQAYKDAKEIFIQKYGAELKGVPKSKINYHALYELGKGQLAERLSEIESEMMMDETIMLQIRVMYHGKDSRGIHSATVSGVVNWEAPYHRSSGAVYRNTGFKMETEDFKEIEITWKTESGLKKKLAKALKDVKKALF